MPVESAELFVPRKDFEAIRQGRPSLVVLNSEADTLGTVASGDQVCLRETLEGFPSRRWMVLSLGTIGPPSDDGTAINFRFPPVAYHDGGDA